jgi:hypothetical protein
LSGGRGLTRIFTDRGFQRAINRTTDRNPSFLIDGHGLLKRSKWRQQNGLGANSRENRGKIPLGKVE